uniref:Uncharacterized protein n=1 Tax=Globodera rostochiensis TaxID=31243 RepID=A0A914H5Q7_GLORO
MNINYRTIFKILILFITFFIFTNGDDSENSTGGGPVYVYFKGVVHGAGEHELVLDLFCDHQKFDFYTGANGKFNVQIDEQIVSHLSCCAQWITIGFYKKDTKASQPSCWGFKSSKKVLKCYAIVNVDWLKFGETTFTQETRDQQVDASAEIENEFRVVFGRGGYAAVNGKVVGFGLKLFPNINDNCHQPRMAS